MMVDIQGICLFPSPRPEDFTHVTIILVWEGGPSEVLVWCPSASLQSLLYQEVDEGSSG